MRPDISIRELRDRLVSLHDDLGISGHLLAPKLARQYQEAVAHCIAAVEDSQDGTWPPRSSGNIIEFRPTG